MTTTKVSVRKDVVPSELSAQAPQPFVLSKSKDEQLRTPRNDNINPLVLLEDLKAKQRQYQTLKNEGLILPDHRAMEVKLQETIFELEGLLKEMEGS